MVSFCQDQKSLFASLVFAKIVLLLHSQPQNMFTRFIPSLLILTPLLLSSPVKAEEQLECLAPQYQVFDKPTCFWPKEISSQCKSLGKDSVFAQCNVFDLAIGGDRERVDDQGNRYLSSIFKYAERNECSTGSNDGLSILGQCDTFAAYAQILRDLKSSKCYALVNVALLGTQLQEDSLRNSPYKTVQKLEIPGVSRRIIFTPSADSAILSQSSSSLIRTSNQSRLYTATGPAISGLYFLELESALTTKSDNLKPNPAKIRITRGVGTNSDFLDIPLGKGNEEALNRILSGCSS